MDFTAFAVKLIEAYQGEHNRMRRARALQHKIMSNQKWINSMRDLGLSCYFHHSRTSTRAYDYKQARNYFQDSNFNRAEHVFVSHQVKNARLRKLNHDLALLRARYEEFTGFVVGKRVEIERVKNLPVRTDLGEIWRKLVDSHSEEKDAYDARWEARCAISAFNKMKTGIQIKFGNCRRGGGSMSYISHVVIDGDKIKLAKFLDNARFESALLY